jgi:4-hydroxy-4-methyl-2-oxoglutarate aldolase
MSDAKKAPVSSIAGHPTGFVVDALARTGRNGWVQGAWPRSRATKFTGRARTMLYLPSEQVKRPVTRSMYEIMRSLSPGEILVVATGAADCWFMGENMVHEALYSGLGGIVTDGCIRDSAELLEIALPVFSRGISVVPPLNRYAVAELDGPVILGGATVCPGDVVHADADGVVVVNKAFLGDIERHVAELAELEARQERAIRDRLPLPQLHEILALKKGAKPGTSKDEAARRAPSDAAGS